MQFRGHIGEKILRALKNDSFVGIKRTRCVRRQTRFEDGFPIKEPLWEAHLQQVEEERLGPKLFNKGKEKKRKHGSCFECRLQSPFPEAFLVEGRNSQLSSEPWHPTFWTPPPGLGLPSGTQTRHSLNYKQPKSIWGWRSKRGPCRPTSPFMTPVPPASGSAGLGVLFPSTEHLWRMTYDKNTARKVKGAITNWSHRAPSIYR